MVIGTKHAPREVWLQCAKCKKVIKEGQIIPNEKTNSKTKKKTTKAKKVAKKKARKSTKKAVKKTKKKTKTIE